MTVKKLIPYAGIPILIALYLAFKAGTSDAPTVIRGVMLIAFLYIAAYSDIKTRQIPNRLVAAMFLAWLAFISVYIIADIGAAIPVLVQSLLGGAAAGGFFLFLYIVSRRGVGGGDVKLMAAAGLYLTVAKLMPMLFISSMLAALVSAVLLIAKRVTMKTAIPLAPFLYLGMLVTIFSA